MSQLYSKDDLTKLGFKINDDSIFNQPKTMKDGTIVNFAEFSSPLDLALMVGNQIAFDTDIASVPIGDSFAKDAFEMYEKVAIENIFDDFSKETKDLMQKHGFTKDDLAGMMIAEGHIAVSKDSKTIEAIVKTAMAHTVKLNEANMQETFDILTNEDLFVESGVNFNKVIMSGDIAVPLTGLNKGTTIEEFQKTIHTAKLKEFEDKSYFIDESAIKNPSGPYLSRKERKNIREAMAQHKDIYFRGIKIENPETELNRNLVRIQRGFEGLDYFSKSEEERIARDSKASAGTPEREQAIESLYERRNSPNFDYIIPQTISSLTIQDMLLEWNDFSDKNKKQPLYIKAFNGILENIVDEHDLQSKLIAMQDKYASLDVWSRETHDSLEERQVINTYSSGDPEKIVDVRPSAGEKREDRQLNHLKYLKLDKDPATGKYQFSNESGLPTEFTDAMLSGSAIKLEDSIFLFHGKAIKGKDFASVADVIAEADIFEANYLKLNAAKRAIADARTADITNIDNVKEAIHDTIEMGHDYEFKLKCFDISHSASFANLKDPSTGKFKDPSTLKPSDLSDMVLDFLSDPSKDHNADFIFAFGKAIRIDWSKSQSDILAEIEPQLLDIYKTYYALDDKDKLRADSIIPRKAYEELANNGFKTVTDGYYNLPEERKETILRGAKPYSAKIEPAKLAERDDGYQAKLRYIDNLVKVASTYFPGYNWSNDVRKMFDDLKAASLSGNAHDIADEVLKAVQDKMEGLANHDESLTQLEQADKVVYINVEKYREATEAAKIKYENDMSQYHKNHMQEGTIFIGRDHNGPEHDAVIQSFQRGETKINTFLFRKGLAPIDKATTYGSTEHDEDIKDPTDRTSSDAPASPVPPRTFSKEFRNDLLGKYYATWNSIGQDPNAPATSLSAKNKAREEAIKKAMKYKTYATKIEILQKMYASIKDFTSDDGRESARKYQDLLEKATKQFREEFLNEGEKQAALSVLAQLEELSILGNLANITDAEKGDIGATIDNCAQTAIDGPKLRISVQNAIRSPLTVSEQAKVVESLKALDKTKRKEEEVDSI